MHEVARCRHQLPISRAATAEFVTKVHAVCVCCGELAAYSYRIAASEKQILLGETDSYEARCRPCFLAGDSIKTGGNEQVILNKEG
ncbi:MAG: hypothetical protein ABI383_13215 [Acidobacteriaceae bacterium]